MVTKIAVITDLEYSIADLKLTSLTSEENKGLFRNRNIETIGYAVDNVGRVVWFINLIFDRFKQPVSIQLKDVNGKCLHYTSYSDALATITA